MDTTSSELDLKIVQPYIGERVLVVPQAKSELMNIHRLDTIAVGKPPHELLPVCGDRARDVSKQERFTLPEWDTYTHTLLRRGFGLLVVRKGVFRLGPTFWDSGD